MRVSLFFFFLFLSSVHNLYANEIEQFIIELKKQKEVIENEYCPGQYDLLNVDSVKQKITCLYKVDQYVLNRILHYQEYREVKDFLQEISKIGGESLKKIIHHHGWPIISKFGEKTDFEAWLLVQHADYDPLFQAAIAFLLGQLVEKGETSKQNYAYLFDRVVLKYRFLGLKQKYGTQFRISDNDLVLQPYEGTLKDLIINRKKMGLESLEVNLNRNKKMYLAPRAGSS